MADFDVVRRWQLDNAATNFSGNGSHWRKPMTSTLTTTSSIAGIKVPDSKLARAVTELVRDTETPLLFHHSSRVYYFGALAGKRRGLKFDPELLYTGAMFHDMGPTPKHSSNQERFEVDGATRPLYR